MKFKLRQPDLWILAVSYGLPSLALTIIFYYFSIDTFSEVLRPLCALLAYGKENLRN